MELNTRLWERLIGKGWDWLTLQLSLPETYVQAALILTAFALAYLLASLLRRRVPALRKLPEGHDERSKYYFFHRLGALIAPVLALLFLGGAAEIAAESLEIKAEFIRAAGRVTLIWLLWVAMRAFVDNAVVQTVGTWLLLPAALLQLFGWFKPTAAYLDRLGFSVGNIDITVYTVLKALLFFSIILWVGKAISQTIENSIRRKRNMNVSMQELFVKLIDILLYVMLFVVTMNAIGIDLTALSVFGGALGVGLGFGLQKIASNFISGIILLSERSIRIGDIVEMDSGIQGYVRKQGARASIVETFDGREVLVPNEDFITSRVANLTYSDREGWLSVPFGVSYGNDMEQVARLAVEAAAAHPEVLKSPAPACVMEAFIESAVNFNLTFWIKDITKGRARPKHEVMLALLEIFRREGVEMPPQRDMLLKGKLDIHSSRAPQPEPGARPATSAKETTATAPSSPTRAKPPAKRKKRVS